ncbi:MAG TPA: sugar phosphate isomerase/epimerase [Cyanobacteria bacterium UBA11371]|nr:sugar phosphate isomerase/epimerase [Cyanobacteria bacterium UBA11371]
MRRKIGVTTWVFGNIELVDIAEMVAQMGFDGVELYVDIDRVSPQEVKKILADKGLEIFSLTPGNVDLASSDRHIRNHAIAYYKKLIDYAAELGQPIVVCHEYIQNQTGSVYTGSLEFLSESCREIALHAAGANIKLGFEPLNRYLCRFVLKSTDVLDLLSEINAENMTVVLDAFHMNIEEDDPVKAIRRCGEQLSLYQIADSNRKGIGFGHISFEEHLAALDAIQYNGPIVIECAHPRQTPGSQSEGSLDELKFYLSASKDWLDLKKPGF